MEGAFLFGRAPLVLGWTATDKFSLGATLRLSVKTRVPVIKDPQHGLTGWPVLFLCFFDPESISTVPETIAFIQEHSRFAVHVVNLFTERNGSGHLKLSTAVRLDRYAAVVIHNSVSYNVDNLYSLDRLSSCRLIDYSGIKVLFKQDENFRHLEMSEYIGHTGFDLIFTCLLEKDRLKVYPTERAGSPRFVQMLTGYVTPTHREIQSVESPRRVDVGYRGSTQPLSFGRLAWEKRKIGLDVTARLAESGLVLDISSRWEDRIGGGEWLHFLASCKATLGAESGASVFDLDGSLAARCRAAEAKLGPVREDSAYVEAYLKELQDLEGIVDYAQVSPRHFEAAATGTLQLLYPGTYSGIFRSGSHFFELARDCSNLAEAVDVLRDPVQRLRYTEAAYEEIILNEGFWIESFVKRFDDELDAALSRYGNCALPFGQSRSSSGSEILVNQNSTSSGVTQSLLMRFWPSTQAKSRSRRVLARKRAEIRMREWASRLWRQAPSGFRAWWTPTLNRILGRGPVGR